MLAVSSSGALDQAAQRARLRQFLISLLPITFCFGLLYGGIGAIFGDLPTVINGAIIFGYGCIELIAWAQFRRDHMQAAVLITCIGQLILALVITILQPALYPNFGVVPLVAVAVALGLGRGESAAMLLERNSVGFIDAESGRVTQRILLGGRKPAP